MADCSHGGPLAVKTRTCRFFQTQKGCRFGNDCRFVHIKKLLDESIASFREDDELHGGNEEQVNSKSRTEENEPLVKEKEVEKQGDSSKGRQEIVCKFFQRKRGCLRGDNCPFEHVISNHVHERVVQESFGASETTRKRTRHRRKKTARTPTNDTQKTRVDVVEVELDNCVDKPSGEGDPLSQEANMNSYVTSRNVAEFEETGKRVTCHEKYNRTKDTAAAKGELTNAKGKDKNVVKPVRARGQTLPIENNNVSDSREVLAGNPFHQQNRLMQSTDAGIGGPLTKKNNYDTRHTASAKGIPIPTQGTVKQRQGVPIPKMEVPTKGTEYQKKNLISDKKNIARHQEEDKENASAVRGTYTLADAIFAEPKRLRLTEIQQLKRRFGDKGGYCEIKENSCFKIKVKPTDPDWPFQIEAVYLLVSFPDDYPLQIFSVSLSEEQDLPQDIISFVTQRIQHWVLQQEQTGKRQASLKLYFRPFLRWFDKNLVSFFIDAGKEMRKTFVSSITGLDNRAGEIRPTDEQKLVVHDAVNGSQPNTQHGEDNDFGSWQLLDTIANSKSLKGSEINVVSSDDGFDCNVIMKDCKGKEVLNVQADASCSTFQVTPHDNSKDSTGNQDTDISSINPNVICGNASSMLGADHGQQAVGISSSNCDQNRNTDYEAQPSQSDTCSTDQNSSTGCGAQSSQSDSCGNDNASAKSAERGTQIQFKGLHLGESTSSLRGNKVVLTLECSRCKQRLDQQLSASGPVIKQCTRCASAFAVVFRPAIIHQFSSILGYLDLDGCVPFDVVLPESELLLGCFHCSKETTVKGLQYGGNWSWCSHCHQKLSFQVQSTRFQQLQSGVATAVALRKSTVSGISSKPKKPQSSGVKEGQPLPANGTCKHYKKSYRWLRFPCCGKCYPCDLCHEEEEDHEMKYATRMVCGFCSREQPYSQQPCSGCKAAVTKSRSAYWEGGKGCRDKVAMSRNDDQKYRQQGKTTSRKAQKRSEGKGKGHKGK